MNSHFFHYSLREPKSQDLYGGSTMQTREWSPCHWFLIMVDGTTIIPDYRIINLIRGFFRSQCLKKEPMSVGHEYRREYLEINLLSDGFDPVFGPLMERAGFSEISPLLSHDVHGELWIQHFKITSCRKNTCTTRSTSHGEHVSITSLSKASNSSKHKSWDLYAGRLRNFLTKFKKIPCRKCYVIRQA